MFRWQTTPRAGPPVDAAALDAITCSFRFFAMSRVLLTAFEPFGDWNANASWLTLERITSDLPAAPQVTTRRYPVDFGALREPLERDLQENYDVALFLGQSGGSTAIQLEAIGLNVAKETGLPDEDARPLFADGPVAYRTELPVESWARALRSMGIPTQASYHAGAYLCNAALYTAHYLIERLGLRTQAAFIHVPLDPSQVLDKANPPASLPVEISAAAVRWILGEFAPTDLA